MTRCARCPSDVPDSAHFCPACGTEVAPDEGITRSRPIAPSPTPREAPRRSSSASATAGPASSTIDHGRFLPGVLVGERYRIVAMLGRGGMGEVYRADDLTVGQSVALKFLPPRFAKDPERLDRLRGEVRAARAVSHPNVCRVYDIADAGGEHFISMELVQGEDLASLLRRIGHLPGEKGLQIARQLCSGVAAAHARGVLHRDLKPANVMLDERGTVRIMDFGLAGAFAQFEGDAVREGTPAYMAPEQLAGRSVSVASDVYALGLILYEIFTGRSAFPAGSVAEMLRQREHDSATPPSDLVDGIDDAVERAILRCLESDPGQRPSSASAVAAALPGGDPLAAALAAGETPSPDMVAAAGGEGALRPAAAWGLCGAILAVLVCLLLVWPYSTDLGVAPLPRSADALTDRARDVLRNLGYEQAGDETRWFERNYDYLLYEATHLRPLRAVEAWPGSAGFYYRRSPRPLVPFASALVNLEDPPMTLSGMTCLRLTPTGDLLDLTVVPPQVEEGSGPWPEPDWKAVLAQTGLDTAHLAVTQPRWAPPVASDMRMAWEGTPWPARPPVRVEAAAFHGRPVYVAVLGPWSKPTRMPDRAGDPFKNSLRVAVGAFVGNLLATVVIVLAAVLAQRNLRLGRGHRRGAFRIAAAFVVLAVVGWLFQTHHVLDVAGEWRLFLVSASFSVLGGGFVWLSYMALEPYIRRRWPSILIGWSRVLAGRLTDPLVGRDILIGALGGTLIGLVNHVANALPAWLPLAGQTPIFSDRRALGSTSELVGLFTGVCSGAIVSSLVLLGLLFVARLLVNRAWLAVALSALVLTLLNLGAENVAIESIVAVVAGIGPAIMLARYGMLSLWAMTLVSQLLIRFPVTLELTRWYGGGTVFLFGVLLALLVYAFRVSLGGRPAFSHATLGE